MPQKLLQRRVLVKAALLLGSAAALPLRQALSAELPRLDVKDPTATALGYVEHFTDVDVKKFPAYVKGSMCENCSQLQGSAGENYRPCSLFPGKSVSVSGWCSGWTVEM